LKSQLCQEKAGKNGTKFRKDTEKRKRKKNYEKY